MRIPRPRRAKRASAAVLALAAASACGESPPRAAPTALSLSPCHLAGDGTQVVAGECGTLRVFENRATSTGRAIDLAVAVVRATGRNPVPDPVFFLAGGPGGSALGMYPPLAGAFTSLNIKHDIVLVDQRGTGKSAALDCPEPPGAAPDTTRGEAVLRLKACGESLVQRADLRQYTTAIAMDDLDDVRAALGYEKIDLYGSSYGTRAALVYLRRHEGHVRAVALDGVAPPDWAVGATTGRDGQRAMNLVFARCAADAACNEAFPNLPAALTALMSAHEKPETVVVPHPTSAKAVSLPFGRYGIASTLHTLSYTSESAALLPLLVSSASATSDLRPLAAQALMIPEMLRLSEGAYFSVICSEDAPYFDDATLAADNAGSYGGSEWGRTTLDVCAGWPRATLAAADRAPVASNVPVLLLSGEQDPVTPPSNATAAAQTLPNSLHVTVPGQGHGAIVSSCARRILNDFVDTADVKKVRTDCFDDEKPMRFFTSFAGPKP